MCNRQLLFVLAMAVCVSSVQASQKPLPERVEDGVMLHCHQWPFKAIEDNLDRIASAGFNAIQVSPIQRIRKPKPNEKTSQDPTGPWYLFYQPVSFKDIGNDKLGTEQAFKSLCEKAEQKNIKIIVDVVLNHIADTGKPVEADDELDPVLRDNSLYHHNGSIESYQDRWQLTQRKLGSLPDLNTQDQRIQDMHVAFLNKCVQLGADGFRFDAAKHIETSGGEDKDWAGDYWEDVLLRINHLNKLYLFTEVLQDKGDNLNMYLTFCDVTCHTYGSVLRQAVTSRNTHALQGHLAELSGIKLSKCLAYVENHDDYEHNASRQMDYWERKVANALLISRAGLTPRILDRPEDNIWEDPDIVAVNQFRNRVVGTPEFLRFPSKHIVIVEKGKNAMVIVNLGHESALDTETALFDGSYVNQAATPCTLEVSSGRLKGTLPGGIIFAAYPENSNKTICRVKYDVGWGHHLYIRGNTEPLYWSKGIRMQWNKGNIWTWESSSFLPEEEVEFKILIDDRKWEIVDGNSLKNHAVRGCNTIGITPNFPQ